MTRIERVLAAINHAEPDRVPKGEVGGGVSDELAIDLLDPRGECSTPWSFGATELNVAARRVLGMDIMSLCLPGPPEEHVPLEDDRVLCRDAFGCERERHPGGQSRKVRHCLLSPSDVYDYRFPSADQFDTAIVTSLVRESDFFVFPVVTGAFEASYEFLDFEDFMVWCRSSKREIKEWTRKLARFGAACATGAVRAGAHGIVVADDLAYNTGMFLSPELMRELVFPYLEEEVAEIKALGVPVFLHSDGDIRPVLADIVAMGFNGWHGIQPSAGLDLVEIKRVCGDRLCLMGNVDVDLLVRGQPEEIEREVERLIRLAAPGGGFILSSSNALCSGVSAANALAMYRTAERCEPTSLMRC
ncbi:MAG: hypothetical protein HYY08_03605 [Firmicutes bacterium]|nr:hypothetical protein [Bacillota bacterium]